MSRSAKIILGVVGGLVAVCCIGVIISVVLLNVFSDDIEQAVEEAAEGAIAESPDEVADVAAGIADYELPAGFQEQTGFEILGTSTVMFASPSKSMVIMMMQFPSSLNFTEEDMMTQIRSANTQSSNSAQFEYVDSFDADVRGTTHTFSVLEGTDENGEMARQVIGAFEGNNGDAIMMAIGPIDSWDQDALETFIASLK